MLEGLTENDTIEPSDCVSPIFSPFPSVNIDYILSLKKNFVFISIGKGDLEKRPKHHNSF